MRVRFMDVLAFVSTACAVTLTIAVLARRSAGETVGPIASTEPVLLDNWESLGEVGHRFGDPASPVTIVEFSDFECPHCGQFAANQLRVIRERYAGQVKVVFRHWPLPMHRLAYPTARASECAADQGRFWEFHDAVFAAQDSIGLIPFADFAQRAGVPDLTTFNDCNSQGRPVAVIDRDVRAAEEIGATGTPTLVINGWRLKGSPTLAMLDSIVRANLEASQ